MRAVRCNACGTKALTAASKCPTCGHMIEVRDGRGELLSLSYCSSCDSYYPESVGTCKWCGTKPERAPIGPYVWKGVGVAALVVLAAGSWLMRDSRPKRPADARVATSVKSNSPSIPADTGAPPKAVTTDDTAALRMAIATADSIYRDTTPARTRVSAAPIDTAVMQAAAPTVAPPPLIERASAKLASAVAPKSRPASRWANSISRKWVIVRTGPSHGARIVASIGPASRVQLGEWQGPWRRIKAKGVVGWVEPRSYFAAVRTPAKTGLAAR